MRYILHWGKRLLTFIWMKICQFISYIFLRESAELKKLKNIHKGQRVFIVATGPSLTMEDLELIKNEYSISMNSIVNSFNQTSFRPTYYMIQDGNVIDRIHKQINECDLKSVYIGVGNARLMKVNVGRNREKLIQKKRIKYRLNLAYHYYDMCYKPNKSKMVFSDNFARQSYDGFTVTYSAIQFAYYLGFSEIYLLGCDCTYGGHFDDKDHENNNNLNKVKPSYFAAYECARKFFTDRGVKIFNCTRGGMLDIYTRKNLEEIVSI